MDRLPSELLDELARIYARAAARAYFSQMLADEARSRDRGLTPRLARPDQRLDESPDQASREGTTPVPVAGNLLEAIADLLVKYEVKSPKRVKP